MDATVTNTDAVSDLADNETTTDCERKVLQMFRDTLGLTIKEDKSKPAIGSAPRKGNRSDEQLSNNIIMGNLDL
ncbi:hypothetical protein BaRGS_00026760 [Batillaria attramentaria]|uniref:Reverse transcriptase domain-containing protein n=1 Tax=Batillaria attramentaria TaxID=370345 RepID=A0ABD0K3H6_9CAEN